MIEAGARSGLEALLARRDIASSLTSVFGSGTSLVENAWWARRTATTEARRIARRKELDVRVEFTQPAIALVGLVRAERGEAPNVVVRAATQIRVWRGDRTWRSARLLGLPRRLRGQVSASLLRRSCYLTLAWGAGGWNVWRVEHHLGAGDHLSESVVASPWEDDPHVRDAAVLELAAEEGLADARDDHAITTGRREVLDGAHAATLDDLALVDPRFSHDAIVASVRSIVVAWTRAGHGDADELNRWATSEVAGLLSDAGTLRAAEVRSVQPLAVDGRNHDAHVQLRVVVRGALFDPDHTTPINVHRATRLITLHWTLAPSDDDQIPWRLTKTAGRLAYRAGDAEHVRRPRKGRSS